MSYIKVLRLKEVVNRTGLSKSKIYDAIKKGEFPKPVKIFKNGRAVCWNEQAINDFLSNILEQAA
jgi:prophage regulatory protein